MPAISAIIVNLPVKNLGHAMPFFAGPIPCRATSAAAPTAAAAAAASVAQRRS